MSTVTTAASSPGRAGDQAPAESLVELMHRRLNDAADRRAIVDTLAEAVAHSYQLEPTNPVYRHNHAAVMIALGREPAETARLTLELLNRSPESVPCQINHALAMINRHRFSDAESLLVQILWVGRTSAEETQIHYAWMLIDEARQRGDSARNHARAARESDLLPPQRQKRAAVLSGGDTLKKSG